VGRRHHVFLRCHACSSGSKSLWWRRSRGPRFCRQGLPSNIILRAPRVGSTHMFNKNTKGCRQNRNWKVTFSRVSDSPSSYKIPYLHDKGGVVCVCVPKKREKRRKFVSLTQNALALDMLKAVSWAALHVRDSTEGRETKHNGRKSKRYVFLSLCVRGSCTDLITPGYLHEECSFVRKKNLPFKTTVRLSCLVLSCLV
jgi:hypothetical protein